GSLVRIEVKQPRRGRRDAKRRSQVARPDPAIEDGGTVKRKTKTYHRLVTGNDCLADHRRLARQHRREGERARNDDRARRDHRCEMNIVDLAQPGERAVDQDVESGFGGRSPVVGVKPPKMPRLLRTGGGDPGHQGIDDVELKPSTERLRYAAADAVRNKGTK